MERDLKRNIFVGVIVALVTSLVTTLVVTSTDYVASVMDTAGQGRQAEYEKELYIKFLNQLKADSLDSIERDFARIEAAQNRLLSEIPRGEVAAFDLRSCPEGWSVFEPARGKFILGAETREDFGDRGGEAQVLLQYQHLPAHQHETRLGTLPHQHIFGSGGNKDTVHGGAYAPAAAALTSRAGGGIAHNNMPPYYVLTYCRKD
ncbi:hypothetical protein FKG94_03030 [Exilibacterium tricleocarpae]|uniref:Tail fiber protein n=1 Tax=Exilibacterium tricleocarpae TaxID=2591008 RepID=A0A545U6U1_9GAMM|nr:hypothetical protein [Exilibacterium tricleocarpae]TQV85177.1 hypothetical protein FKG94_03030 [Exilibacterium tricleocarpae]